MPKYRDTLAGWAEAFKIFVKYQPRDKFEMVHIYQEELRVFVSPDLVSQEDKNRLRDLGWDWQNYYHISCDRTVEEGCFVREAYINSDFDWL